MAFPFDFVSATFSSLLDIIPFLSNYSKTGSVHKKMVIRELRDNLKIIKNAHQNKINYNIVVDKLSNDAIKKAIADNFDFDKIKRGKIKKEHVYDKRNSRYTGWSAGKLMDKIDEKIEELKNLKAMKGNLQEVDNNVGLLMSNLYYRLKLMADFLYED